LAFAKCPSTRWQQRSATEIKENFMRLTTKGRFAVTAMIDLALRENSGPVALAAISGRQQISLSYLEQLFGKLRRHELVESTRGPGGGYSLGRKSESITVADIIVAVDEPIDATGCKKLVDEQIAKGVSIEEHPVKRAISTQPVVKPIKITAPNSVFALGAAFTK